MLASYEQFMAANVVPFIQAADALADDMPHVHLQVELAGVEV